MRAAAPPAELRRRRLHDAGRSEDSARAAAIRPSGDSSRAASSVASSASRPINGARSPGMPHVDSDRLRSAGRLDAVAPALALQCDAHRQLELEAGAGRCLRPLAPARILPGSAISPGEPSTSTPSPATSAGSARRPWGITSPVLTMVQIWSDGVVARRLCSARPAAPHLQRGQRRPRRVILRTLGTPKTCLTASPINFFSRATHDSTTPTWRGSRLAGLGPFRSSWSPSARGASHSAKRS